jgi:hypothetical protein
MQSFKGQNFESRVFDMDETVFFNCKLKDCDLYYSGGDFEWTQTSFENCRWHWRGAAKNMVILAQLIGMIPLQVGALPAIPTSGATKPN